MGRYFRFIEMIFRSLFFLFLLSFSSFSFSESAWWAPYATQLSSSASAACDHYVTRPQVSSSFIGFGHRLNGTASCQRCDTNNTTNCINWATMTYATCPTGQLPTASGTTGWTCQSCPSGKEVSGIQCVDICPPGKVRNSVNSQCQTPCPASGTHHSTITDVSTELGGPSHDGQSFCTAGCSVIETPGISINICKPAGYTGTDPTPCVTDQWNFQYSGNFCGADTPAAAASGGVPVCPSNTDQVGNACLSKCLPGQSRDAGQNCVDPTCVTNEILINHHCETKVNCPAGTRPNASNECAALACNPGEVISYVLDKCVADPNACPVGTHREGLNCVSDSATPAKSCEPGYHLSADSKYCVPDLKVCPAGTHLVGEQCVSDNAPVNACPVGEHLESGRCVSDSGPVKTCPAGQHLDGEQCVSDAPPAKTCPAGQHLDGENCVSDTNPSDPPTTPSKTCPAGQHLDGENCVSDTDPTKTCPDDQVLEGDKCVSKSGPVKTCPAGQHLDGEDCVSDSAPTDGGKKTPTKTCPSGLVPLGEKCVSPGTGPNSGSGSGSGGTPSGGPAGGDDGSGGDGSGDGEGDDEGGSAPGPLGSLYTSKGLTFANVWNDFSAKVQSAQIVNAGAAFFSIGAISATCPVWTLPASDYWASQSITIQCSESVTAGFRIAAVVILIVAAWVAFRIAILD